VPICILLAPQGAAQETKETLMRSLTTHIDEAYAITTTDISLHEVERCDAMLAGTMLSDLADAGGRATVGED
jgi:hypothetical protein